MWVGNLFLVLLNVPLIRIWVRVLEVPQRVLFPTIVGFACIGTFSLNLNPYDAYAIAFFGLLGYLLHPPDLARAAERGGGAVGAHRMTPAASRGFPLRRRGKNC